MDPVLCRPLILNQSIQGERSCVDSFGGAAAPDEPSLLLLLQVLCACVGISKESSAEICFSVAWLMRTKWPLSAVRRR